MPRKNEAEVLLRAGHCPSEIAKTMGISVSSAIQYLRMRVGEGSLRLSDIYFSWTKEQRAAMQRSAKSEQTDHRSLASIGVSRNELDLFQSLRESHVFRGDMYEYVSSVELIIHELVRKVLELEFG